MKTIFLAVVLIVVVGAYPTRVLADAEILISVKLITKNDGTKPVGGLADRANFEGEVNYANQVLAATGRGFRLKLAEWICITPTSPDPAHAEGWFDYDWALSNETQAQVFYARATGSGELVPDPDWKLEPKMVNVYINGIENGGLGGYGRAASDGGPAYVVLQKNSDSKGLLVHEVGHCFNLKHTFDEFLLGWRDGDGLADTLPDDRDVTRQDVETEYPDSMGFSQLQRDHLWLNAMSYHDLAANETHVLTPMQMDVWNNAIYLANRRPTWRQVRYMNPSGSDLGNDGSTLGTPWRTLRHALVESSKSLSTTPDDVIVMTTGNYFNPGNRLGVPCSLRKTGSGAVRLVKE